MFCVTTARSAFPPAPARPASGARRSAPHPAGAFFRGKSGKTPTWCAKKKSNAIKIRLGRVGVRSAQYSPFGPAKIGNPALGGNARAAEKDDAARFVDAGAQLFVHVRLPLVSVCTGAPPDRSPVWICRGLPSHPSVRGEEPILFKKSGGPLAVSVRFLANASPALARHHGSRFASTAKTTALS